MLALLLEAALRSLVLGGIIWFGLKLLRMRDPRVQMTAWTVVLIASLSMPLMMQWVVVTLPSAAPPARLVEIFGMPPAPPVDGVPTAGLSQAPGAPALDAPALESNATQAHRDAMFPAGDRGIGQWADWAALATGIYCLVAAVLLARLFIGIMLTWRLARRARPVGDAGPNVRVCDVVGVPVTFASTILLPPECSEWSPAKRQAVLSHERSHVARGDCYVLLLAALNRAIFWFSPFAWWQFARLAELAEMISDDAAIEVLADRPSYAHILLDLAGHARRAPASLAMARAGTVGRRVERILATTAMPSRTGWRKQLLVAAALAPVVAICAASIARSTLSPAEPAAAVLAQPRAAEAPVAGRESQAAVTVEAQVLDAHVGYYRLNPQSILAITREGDQLFAQLTGERKLRIFPQSDREFLYKAAAARIAFVTDGAHPSAELILHRNGEDLRAVRIADIAGSDRPSIDFAADVLDAHVGWYELHPMRALAVTREGDRLFLQVTGGPKFPVIARSDKDFVSADGKAFVVFTREGQNPTTEVLLHQPAFGPRGGRRVDAGRAVEIQDNLARWMAAAPERFRDQTPAQGSKKAVLEAIADLQQNAPNYRRMSAQLADSVQRNVSDLHAMLTALGALESIFFRGVGPGGYDIYGAKFANGFAEFRLLMAADGRIEDMVFRPDGDDTPGRFASCSDEPTLRPPSGTPPIRWLLYNARGADIQLFELDANGRRLPYGTIGDDQSAAIQTYVAHPWVVADASGQCLEIVLPGQRARFLTVQPASASTPRTASRRATPMPGSEDALRGYIDALARGEPNYHQMTPEVAWQTRRQLPLNQAILAKLGEVRAMSFRGATQFDNDIYVVHFANGSAEWRIGLVKGGTIGRIALGPQY